MGETKNKALRPRGGALHAIVRSVLGGLFVLVVALRSLAAGGGLTDDTPGLEALTSHHEAAGEIDQACEQMLAVIAERPGSQAATLALIRLERWLEDASTQTLEHAHKTLAALHEQRAFAASDRAPRAVANRDRALRLLGRLEAKEGRDAEHKALVRERGVVDRWRVIGPFGWTRHGALERVFAPERAVFGGQGALERSVQTARGRRDWRWLDRLDSEDALRAAEVLPHARGASYLLAQLRWKPGVSARVRVVADGSYKLWCNGRLILEVDHGKAWAQRVHGFDLTPTSEGVLCMLLKVADSSSAVSVRVCDVQARGVPDGFEVLRDEQLLEQAALRVEAIGPEVAPPDADAGVAALVAGAVELLDAGAVDQAVDALERARMLDSDSPWIHHHLARALERAVYLPAGRRDTEARAHWERVLKLAPGWYPARLRAARWMERDGDPVAAFRALRALAGEVAGNPAVFRALAALAARQGWRRERRLALQAWRAMRPGSAVPLLALADLARQDGDVRREAALLEEAIERDAFSFWPRLRLVTLWLQRGEAHRAHEAAKELIERFGARPVSIRALARVELALGNDLEAADRYVQASEAAGGSAWDLVSAAKRYADLASQDAEAAGRAKGRLLDLLGQALELEPERYELRRERARVSEEQDPVERVQQALWVGFDEALAAAPGPEAFPEAHTVCVLDHMVTQLQPDGSRVDTVHQIFRIQDQVGIERYHSVVVPGEVIALRTVSPDGSVSEPVRLAGNDEVLMPRLEPGAVIEIAYRTVREAGPFGLDTGVFYFGDPQFEEPFVLSRWDVLLPTGMSIATLGRGAVQLLEKQDEPSGEKHIRWQRRDVARIEPEPRMPSAEEIVPWRRLLTPLDWQDLAEIHRNRLYGLERPSAEIVRAARKATATVKESALRAKRLYDFVCERVRRPGKAIAASEVFSERAGSRLPLLKAVCDAVGLRARFAVCGRNPQLVPPILWEPLRPELFDALLLVIEPEGEEPVWVSDAGRLAPYGFVPIELAGAEALVLDDAGGACLLQVPVASRWRQQRRSRAVIELNDMDAHVALHARWVTGQSWAFKEQIERTQLPRLRSFVERQANDLFPGARVVRFAFPDTAVRQAPLQVHFEADVAKWVRSRAERFEVPTGLQPLRLVKTLGASPRRRFPFVLRTQFSQVDEVELRLGAQWLVDSVPAPLIEKLPIGRYTLEIRADGDRIRVRRIFDLEPAEVAPEAYAALLERLRRIDEAEARRISLRRVGAE